MHTLEASVTTFVPGKTGCLACYVPTVPPTWQRQFPVFGAVSGTAACIGAMEVIKLITGIGETLCGEMLSTFSAVPADGAGSCTCARSGATAIVEAIVAASAAANVRASVAARSVANGPVFIGSGREAQRAS